MTRFNLYNLFYSTCLLKSPPRPVTSTLQILLKTKPMSLVNNSPLHGVSLVPTISHVSVSRLATTDPNSPSPERFTNHCSSLALQLEIVLTNTLSGNYSETIITAQADVSASNQQSANNVTFYEHSLNYPIPATAPLGNYNVRFFGRCCLGFGTKRELKLVLQVIFMSKDTSTNTTVPVQIIAPAATTSSVAAPSSSAGASASGTLTGSSSNPFASKADKVSPMQMAGFTLAAIGAVAAIVI
jgi:hypothetical protein